MTSEREFQEQMRERVTRRMTGILTKAVMFVILLSLIVFLCAVALYLLWNWLMPALFHLPTIRFWQAVGLLFLSWLLLGGRRGFGGRAYGYRGRWRLRMRERWEAMTPEQREIFRQRLRDCRGREAPPESKPSA